MPCTLSTLPSASPGSGSGGSDTGNGSGGNFQRQGYICGPLRYAACNNGVAPLPMDSGVLPLRDGPQNVYVPAVAADWTALGLPAPLMQWGCQEQAGDLVPAIGAETLTAAGSGLLYEQSITGWVRKFVGSNTTTDQHWHNTSSTFSVATNQGWAWLVYASAATPGTTATLITECSTSWVLQILTTGRVRTSFKGSGNADSSGPSHTGITTVRPYIFYRKQNSPINMGVITDIRSLPNQAGSASDAITNTSSGLGPITGATLNARYGLAAFWKGTDADIISEKVALQALGWTVTW